MMLDCTLEISFLGVLGGMLVSGMVSSGFEMGGRGGLKRELPRK